MSAKNFFSKLLDAIIVFFMQIWLGGLRQKWSRWRWRKALDNDSLIVPKIDERNLLSFLSDVNAHFHWTMDGPTHLFDSVQPPIYAFNAYKVASEDGGVFRGDCDDCHAAIYHALQANGYDVALVTVITAPAGMSHTMCAIKTTGEDGKPVYRVADYNYLRGAYASMDAFAAAYETSKRRVRMWTLDKYDYQKQSYYPVDKADF